MRMKAIASGSSGNSIYVGSDNTHILIDTGISKKRVEAGLTGLDICGNDIDGVLITHEHSDHIGGLGVFLRKYPVKVYGTPGTLGAIKRCKSLGAVDYSLFEEVSYDKIFQIGDLDITPIKTSHDAAQPCAYKVSSGQKNCAVITDLGCYDDYIVEYMKGLDVLFLEANHDVRMLEMGKYPYELKRRILGKYGHLSNETSGRLLNEILHDNMKQVVLSHLSQENNMPDLAFEAVRLEVNMSDSKYNADDFNIQVASRYEPSAYIEF